MRSGIPGGKIGRLNKWLVNFGGQVAAGNSQERFMVRFVVVSILACLCFSGTGFAQIDGLGVGVMLSNPTGVSFKKWGGSMTAIGGGVAWGFGNQDTFRVHIDYLFHNFNLFEISKGSLPLYYGIGGQIEFEDIGVESQNDDNEVGVRAPTTKFKISGGIGIRYFFD